MTTPSSRPDPSAAPPKAHPLPLNEPLPLLLQHALRRGGVWTAAALLMSMVGAALTLALLAAELLGVQGRLWGLVAAALLALVLGAPLVWALHRLAKPQATEAPWPDPRRDELTGVPTRAALMAQLEREWSLAGRHGQAVALLLLEVDRYRQVTERHGASDAQAALRELACSVAQTLRLTDLIGRFGEAQLAVFLPQADLTGALDAADRLRERGALLQVGVLGGAVRITASVGVAVLVPGQQRGAPLSALVEAAEGALHSARLAGGNCVRAAPAAAVQPAPRGPSVGDNQAARGDS